MGIEQQMDMQFPELDNEKIHMANKYKILPTPENLAKIEKHGHQFTYDGKPIEDLEKEKEEFAAHVDELYNDKGDREYWKH